MTTRINVAYDFVYPRSLAPGDHVLIDGIERVITRKNANRSRVTVYFMRPKRAGGETEQGCTYWVEVGEIRAAKVRFP